MQAGESRPKLIQTCRPRAPTGDRSRRSFASMINSRLASAHAALALVLLFSGTGSAQAQRIDPGVDISVAPGDDFFAFANGAWLKTTVIPDGMERWGARNELDQLVR